MRRKIPKVLDMALVNFTIGERSFTWGLQFFLDLLRIILTRVKLI